MIDPGTCLVIGIVILALAFGIAGGEYIADHSYKPYEKSEHPPDEKGENEGEGAAG